MMQPDTRGEDPKEVFLAFSRVIGGLCIAYHDRYPLIPPETIGMVMTDFGKYTVETMIPEIQAMNQRDPQFIPLFQKMGEDLATRIGARSKYDETLQELTAAVCGGE
jgi:hypothetical protein